MRDRLSRPELALAAAAYAQACAASRRHNDLTKAALRVFGAHGADISGCVREHFPDQVKDELRALAREVTAASEAGDMLRPRGVRSATMRALARDVATRDGGGFYGPRPWTR